MNPTDEKNTPHAFHEIPSSREEIKKILNTKSIPTLFWVLCGKAGSGKTSVMEALSSNEIHPLHSSRLVDKQICTQLLFEALLAKELSRNPLRFIVEDKGRKIANLSIPEKLLSAWDKAPHFLIQEPLEKRVENIYQTHIKGKYFVDEQLGFIEQSKSRMNESLYKKLVSLCEKAHKDNDDELHKEWVRALIIEHLDPIFEYYFHHKKPNVVFEGTQAEVIRYLQDETKRLTAIAEELEVSDKSENTKETTLPRETETEA